MLAFYMAFIIICMIGSARLRGPVWLFCIAWLICVGPITFGLIDYPYLHDDQYRLTILLTSTGAAFMAGAFLATLATHSTGPAQPMSPQELTSDFHRFLPIVKTLWFVGTAGAIAQFADFALSGGLSVSSLGELREAVVFKQSATIFGKVSVLMTWASLYCYFFAIVHRKFLSRSQFLWLGSAGICFLMPALLSAGRQAALQIIILTILAQMIHRLRSPEDHRVSGKLFGILIFAIMSLYMGYIAIARGDDRISISKEVILEAFFKYRLNDTFSAMLNFLGSSIRSATIEATVYFTHSAALLDRFWDTSTQFKFYGALSFPFILRQIEGLTGISVEQAYRYKVQLLESQGFTGVGWSTAYSNLYLDFGYAGTLAIMFFLGYFSTGFWRKMMRKGDLNVAALAAIFGLNIAYLPIGFAASDTNILMFIIFTVVMKWYLDSRSGSFGMPVDRMAG